jgi:hypothetical protein
MRVTEISGFSSKRYDHIACMASNTLHAYGSIEKDFSEARRFYVFAVCAAVTFFLYLPAFVLDFAVHNDYMIWSYDNQRCCLRFPESTHLLAVGRPIGAILLNLHFATFTGIKSLAIGRVISFLTILCAYYFFCLVLIKNYGFPFLFSVLSGFLIFLLPSAILYVVWLTNFVPGSLVVLLSVVAYFLISRPSSKETTRNRRKPISLLSLPTLGYFLLFISFFVYPPVAIFCLVFPVIWALFMDSEQWVRKRREIFIQLATIVSLLILYFVVTKSVVTPVLSRVNQAVRDYVLPTSNYQFSLSTNPVEKLHLVDEFLAITFNLWTSNYLPGFYLVMFLFIIGVGIWKFFKLRRQNRGGKETRSALERTATVVFLLGIGAAPVFIPKEGFVAYRIVFTAASMAVVLFLWALHEFCSMYDNRRLLAVSLAIVVFLCTFFASIRIRTFVDNNNREYEFVRNTVRGLDQDKLTKIVVLAPEWGAQIVRGPLFYDFRYMGTNFARMDGIVRASLRELGMTRRRAKKINVSFVPQSIAESPELMRYFCPCINMAWAGFQSGIPAFSAAMGPMVPAVSEGSLSPENSSSQEASVSTPESSKPRASDSPSDSPKRARPVSGPQMIIEGYLGYNVVLYKSRIYGFPQGFKPDYTDPNLSRTKGVLTGNSVKAIIAAVEAIPESENLGLRAPRLVTESYKGYNIVAFQNKFFGFPQQFSPDYEDPDLAKKPGVLIGATEETVKALIDRKPLTTTQKAKPRSNRDR